MIKVLELGMTDTIGGIETYLYSQYQYFDRTQIHCDFINDKKYASLAYEQEFVQLGAGIVRMNANFSHNPLKFLQEFKTLLKEKKYDAIIANATLYSLKQGCEMLVAKQVGIPVRVFHSHIANGKKNGKTLVGWLVENPFCAGNCGKILTNRWACSNIAGKYFFHNKPFQLIHNSIDIQKFSFSSEVRDRVRGGLGLSPSRIVLGNVGRLHYPKNQRFLISVLQECLSKGLDVELWFIGAYQQKWKEYQEVKKNIQRLGVQDRVRFWGQRQDVQDLLMGMDVFLLPSLFEGFPIVGLEAQCAGLPCIFNSSITDEIKICDTVHFLPVSNGSLRWAEEVVRLLHASSQRKNESQVLFQNGYTNQQNVKSVQTAITQALKKRTEDVVKKRE
jgi:glycosyltransferase involved in cell wall biosynthesis